MMTSRIRYMLVLVVFGLQLLFSSMGIAFDLTVDKRLAPGQSSTVLSGDTVHYEIEVINTIGGGDTNNITVTDTLPTGMTYTDQRNVSPAFMASQSSNTGVVPIVWNINSLADGGSIVIAYTVQVIGDGILTNTVTITPEDAAPGEDSIINNTDTVDVSVIGNIIDGECGPSHQGTFYGSGGLPDTLSELCLAGVNTNPIYTNLVGWTWDCVSENGGSTVQCEAYEVYCGNNVIENGQNGTTDGGETCDDGGNVSGDGCSATCQLEGCTNPVAYNYDVLAIEDDGTCRFCGDGVLNNSDGEVCDDGNSNAGDGCSASCDIIESGYVCNTVGSACEDIDECATNTDTCADEASCTNTIGSFSCACNAGYAGDGTTCNDIDECVINNGGCETTCTNNDGGFACSCDVGYSLGVDNMSCEDIDECATNNGGCETTCTNNDGGFACSCDEGYVLDGNGSTCSPVCGDGITLPGIEECDDNNLINGDGCDDACKFESPTCTLSITPGVGLAPLSVTGSSTTSLRSTASILDRKDGTIENTPGEPFSHIYTTTGSFLVSFEVISNITGSNLTGKCTALVEVNTECGNELLEIGEECDEGINNGIECIAGYGETCTYCNTSCKNTIITGNFCGDGINDIGIEQCDDATNNGVICAPGYGGSCTYCNDTCTGILTINGGVCGNGVVESPESCDDGNTLGGDGCSVMCQSEYVHYTGGGGASNNTKSSFLTASIGESNIAIKTEKEKKTANEVEINDDINIEDSISYTKKRSIFEYIKQRNKSILAYHKRKFLKEKNQKPPLESSFVKEHGVSEKKEKIERNKQKFLSDAQQKKLKKEIEKEIEKEISEVFQINGLDRQLTGADKTAIIKTLREYEKKKREKREL